MHKIIGRNSRGYPVQTGEEITITTLLIATIHNNEIFDYAAFSGIGSDAFIMRSGTKLRFDDACCHFPGGQLKQELYRN